MAANSNPDNDDGQVAVPREFLDTIRREIQEEKQTYDTETPQFDDIIEQCWDYRGQDEAVPITQETAEVLLSVTQAAIMTADVTDNQNSAELESAREDLVNALKTVTESIDVPQ